MTDENDISEKDRTVVDGLQRSAKGRRAITDVVAMEPGDMVAQTFKIVRQLGSGGMGEVFLAQDTELGRRVAIKTLKPPSNGDAVSWSRLLQLFRRDAASTAQLSHPNIISIYHLEVHRHSPFIVLEYVDGTPLDKWLAHLGPLGEDQAMDLARQLADALAYAHSRGVIHRDIKPSNLMWTDDGVLKVLDFGISVIRQARDELEVSFGRTLESLRDHLGPVPRNSGTPAFMAPEQLGGPTQDERVDVWAFGVTLFHLMTGELPYKHVAFIDRSFELTWPEGVGVSADVRALIDACVEPRVSQRLRSFAEIRETIDSWVAPTRAVAEERPSNITRPSDCFVGRASEFEALGEFAERGARLITLVGPAGVGKTRLATEWGLDALERSRYTHVRSCSLKEARDEADIVRFVSQALEVPLTQSDVAQQLAWAMQSRHGMLLIFDSCEHVLDPLDALVTGWLTGAPEVTFMVTSRERLNRGEENLLEIEPLTVESDEALELFTARARQAHDAWRCPPGEEEALRELVSQLDGLPLAIELAAARVRMLGPARMLSRMSRRFELLNVSRRSSGNTTLRGALEWSWELLTPVERSTLSQLSVFEGGCTLDDVESVVMLEVESDFSMHMDVLERLVDQSLLRLDPSSGRFSMLMSVQAFASSMLTQDPELLSSTRERHARAFAQWGDGERLNEVRSGHVQGLLREGANIEVARAWAFEAGHARLALTLTLACAAIVERRGPFSSAQGLWADAESCVDAHPDIGHRVVGRLGQLSMLGGNTDAAREMLERAERMALEHGKPGAEGLWRGNLGTLLARAGDIDGARALYEEAYETARATGNLRHECLWVGNLANILQWQGDYDRATTHFERGLALSRELGLPRQQSLWLGNLGNVLLPQGAYARATTHYKRALQLARQVGEARLESLWMGNLGVTAIERGDYPSAAEYLQHAYELAAKIGQRGSEGLWMGNLGLVALRSGEFDEAATLFARALHIASSRNERRHVALWELRLAQLELERGHGELAAERLERSLALCEDLGDRSMKGYVLGTRGRLESMRGQHEEARASWREALALVRELDERTAEILWSGHLGLSLVDSDQDQARAQLKRAIELLSALEVTVDAQVSVITKALADALDEPLEGSPFA